MIVFYLFLLKFLEGNQSLQLFLSKCLYYLSNPYVCIFSNNDLQDEGTFIILKTTWKWNLCFIFLYPSLEILNWHLNINKYFEQYWEIVMFFVTVYYICLFLNCQQFQESCAWNLSQLPVDGSLATLNQWGLLSYL